MTAAGDVLVIRADADTRMGTGHVMRCVALAQAWEEQGGRAVFVAASVPRTVRARLDHEGFAVTTLPQSSGSLEDARRTAEIARREKAAWVLVDGYQFDTEYHRAIKAAGHRLLVIDDYGHAVAYVADLVLNQNAHADESFYQKRDSDTRLLLGTRYAMLRREFWPWRGWRRPIRTVANRLLVTLGGSDPDNVTRQVIEAVAGIDVEGLEVAVLVGGSNPHRLSLETAARDACRPIRLEANVLDMPSWMIWADAAVTAAGGTLWELAFFAVPSVTIVLADNQEPAAAWLAGRGVFPTLGWGTALSVETIRRELRGLLLGRDCRQKQSDAASQLVDGNGVFRVVAMMKGSHP